MHPGRRIGHIAFLLAVVYVGLGSINLFFILYGDDLFLEEWSEQIERFLFPSFILGFALAYLAGVLGAIVGQFITLAGVFGILYGLFRLMGYWFRQHRT